MLCPICAREFGEGYVICPSCEVNLVERETEVPEDPSLPESDTVIKKGRTLTCSICEGTSFIKKAGYLALKESGFLHFAGDEQATINYICNDCGYVLCFIDVPSRFQKQRNLTDNQGDVIDYETSEARADECPICFAKIQSSDRECANCGHKLK